MLLTNRRHRLLFMALAGMEVAWFIPFALTLFLWLQGEDARLPALLRAPTVVLLACWGVLVLYLLAADLLNRWQLESPARDIVMLLLVIGASFLTVRIIVFPTLQLLDLRWLGAVVGAIFNQGSGSAAILLVLLVNLFLWIRVALATDRSLTFFSVGLSFRLGMLLTLAGNTLLILAARQPVSSALVYFWSFFGFGLIAVALARMDDKAMGAQQSTGAALPWSRLGQLLTMVGLMMGATIGAADYYTPQNIRTVLGWFSPLWNALGWVLARLFFFLFWLMLPFLEWLSEVIRQLLAGIEPPKIVEQELGLPDPSATPMTLSEMVRTFAFVRYCLIAGIIVVILTVIWILFARTRQRTISEEAEATANEGLAWGENPLHRLRTLADLFRRHGLGPRLLAAISVQNIYANVCRLASRRGYPRRLAQPPDEYLPQLERAFPDHAEQLVRLTAAYMRVHYGDQPVEAAELDQLREDFAHIRTTSAAPT
ncbi:MAG: DUF4129 domain-containing protein [Caldilineaceae bacterium]